MIIEHLSEFTFEDLANGAERQFIHKNDFLGYFIGGDPFLEEADNALPRSIIRFYAGF
jgi:hypothetical protein